MKRRARSSCVLWITLATIGCGAGLPPEERSAPRGGTTGGTAEAPTSCALTGGPFDFPNVTAAGSILYWATDPQIDIRVDEAKAKLLFDVPAFQLPPGTTSAYIRIAPEPDADLPLSGHLDTAFRISALTPPDLTSFEGSQTPLTLTIRYDPVACEIPPDVEAGLVLGRLNSNGQWQEVCGTRADVGRRQVSCSEADLSFGVFGVIAQSVVLNDSTPPFFPNTTQTLSAKPCLDPAACGASGYIDFQWGAASDGSGSGVTGYRLYVDSAPTVFVANVSGNPIQYQFLPTGSLDIRSTHKYQITAVDRAGNESALYGALLLP
jgi:hypothetical protein